MAFVYLFIPLLFLVFFSLNSKSTEVSIAIAVHLASFSYTYILAEAKNQVISTIDESFLKQNLSFPFFVPPYLQKAVLELKKKKKGFQIQPQ